MRDEFERRPLSRRDLVRGAAVSGEELLLDLDSASFDQATAERRSRVILL